jgi:hypothetical protein
LWCSLALSIEWTVVVPKPYLWTRDTTSPRVMVTMSSTLVKMKVLLVNPMQMAAVLARGPDVH